MQSSTTANPLWSCPNIDDLELRAQQGGFRHNWEFFLVKTKAKRVLTGVSERAQFGKVPWSSFIKRAPYAWFQYPETHQLSLYDRQRLWWAYLEFLYSGRLFRRESVISQLSVRQPISCLQRLARLGVIFPGMVGSEELRSRLNQPISSSLGRQTTSEEHVVRVAAATHDYDRVRAIVRPHVSSPRAEKRLHQVTLRLVRAGELA